MILLFSFPGAGELASLLRRRGVYAIVRETPSPDELAALRAAVLPPEQLSAVPRLKNGDEALALLLVGGERTGNALFCDAVAPSAQELPAAAEALLRRLPGGWELTVTHGLALDLAVRRAEAGGRPLPLTHAEFHVLRCVALARAPLSAALVSELCTGADNPKTVMTHVGRINRRARALLGAPLLLAGPTGGYRLARPDGGAL